MFGELHSLLLVKLIWSSKKTGSYFNGTMYSYCGCWLGCRITDVVELKRNMHSLYVLKDFYNLKKKECLTAVSIYIL
jgi:hypothetical protein